MFEILKDSNASVEDLTAAYTQAMTFEKKLEGEKAEAHRALMIEQRDCLDPGTKPSKKLTAAKERLENISSKIEAVQFGMEELKARIADRLQVESQERLKQIAKELSAVSSEEERLQKEFLSLAAGAVVIQEKIKGQSLLSDSRGYVTAGIPSLKVELHLLDGSDGTFYSQEVKRFRQESGAQSFSETITGRRDDFVQEQAKLEKMLSADPAEEVERLLDKLDPPAPTPEPTEPEPRKTSEFTIDYDRIGAPDYGEGERLPYKGINEVLHDRANS